LSGLLKIRQTKENKKVSNFFKTIIQSLEVEMKTNKGFKMKQLYKLMDASYHFKNGTSPKNHTSSVNQMLITLFVLLLGIFVFTSCEKDNLVPIITITTQPAATTNVKEGHINGSLSVMADVTDNATLRYQWYSATIADNTGGSTITGETNDTFIIPKMLTAGTYYYFCEVGATGGAKAVRSGMAAVVVDPKEDDINENMMTMITTASTVKIQLVGSGSATINWGDGLQNQTVTLLGISTEYTHSYSATSTNTITIAGENVTSLNCSFNQLTNLDVSKNTALKQLYCEVNQLPSLDVSKNTELTSLGCGSNPINELDVSKNTALEFLSCYSNRLTNLDVSKNSALRSLQCGINTLTELDVSKNTELFDLRCIGNRLANLDVSKNTTLLFLDISNNQFQAEDGNKGLNAFFRTLHSNTITGYTKTIYIRNNPGIATCDQSIATSKGWIVISTH